MAESTQQIDQKGQSEITLRRRLTLPLLTLYGLGVTVGAGIYVLVGATAAKAGVYAPVSFLLAGFVVAFTGFSYGELGTRYPVSAGEAAYTKNGFNSRTLALIVGLMVVASGVVSSAAILIGAASYLGNLIPLSSTMLIVMIILVLGVVAGWGILESVTVAAIITLVEIGGLGFAVGYGFFVEPSLLSEAGTLFPPFEAGAWGGIIAAGLLAFFAFVGFEDIANVAEEVKNPRRTLPWAIILTLVIATIIYFIVASVVVLVVPLEKLGASSAPLALIFETAGGAMQGSFNLIAAIATINGVLIQMIMSSRVLYGLARQGNLPGLFAYISPITRTPIISTGLVMIIILGLALFLPITDLAEMTSRIVLIVFMIVNLALLRLKFLAEKPAHDIFEVPIWVPALGFISCLLMISSALL